MMSAQLARSKFLLLASGVLLSGVFAIAQEPGGGGGGGMPGGGGGSQQPAPGSSPGGNYPGGGMPGGGAAGSPQASMADQAFIREMMESDAVEVQLGQLAQEKSQSDDVKQFGGKIVQIRKQLDDQLAPLAKQLDVSQPRGPDKKTKQEIAKMQAMSGQDFDAEYIRIIEKAHEKDVKSFKQASESAQNPNVQKAAQADGPVIEQHLQAVQKLAQVHNVQMDQKDSKK